jgi:hypothetical protein
MLMESNINQLDKLVNSLKKSKHYLRQKVEVEASYSNLINQLDLKIELLKNNSKPTIKLISCSTALASTLKEHSEANPELRSLYVFETIFCLKDISVITNHCSVIFLIYQAHQKVTERHQKLVDIAAKRNISLFILVEQNKSNNSDKTLTKWLEFQKYIKINDSLLPINNFFNLDNHQQINLYQQFLIERVAIFQNNMIQQNWQEIVEDIEHFFKTEKNTNWRKIQEVKHKYLQAKGIHDYQQNLLKKVFNQIKQQQQQKILDLKQKINQSRSDYLNLFMPDSWMFEIQDIIQLSKIKLEKQTAATYLYLTVKNGNHREYIDSYILSLYQQKVTETLNSQWSNINYVYANGGLNKLIEQVNQKLATITLLETSEIDSSKVDLNLEPLPELDLAKIIDADCLKLNSRMIFDYDYTQSSWFKLLISVLIGSGIYLVTKLYSGTGKYIGFFILFFQIINLLTGQSIRKTKLKNCQKELQRNVSNKYQILIRLIVEQLIQTLIISLEQKNQQYQENIDAIADFAYSKLDQIKQDINQYQLRKESLQQDLQKIKSWFD